MPYSTVCFENLRKIRNPKVILTEFAQRPGNHMFSSNASCFSATKRKEVQFNFLDVSTEQRVRRSRGSVVGVEILGRVVLSFQGFEF